MEIFQLASLWVLLAAATVFVAGMRGHIKGGPRFVLWFSGSFALWPLMLLVTLFVPVAPHQ